MATENKQEEFLIDISVLNNVSKIEKTIKLKFDNLTQLMQLSVIAKVHNLLLLNVVQYNGQEFSLILVLKNRDNSASWFHLPFYTKIDWVDSDLNTKVNIKASTKPSNQGRPERLLVMDVPKQVIPAEIYESDIKSILVAFEGFTLNTSKDIPGADFFIINSYPIYESYQGYWVQKAIASTESTPALKSKELEVDDKLHRLFDFSALRFFSKLKPFAKFGNIILFNGDFPDQFESGIHKPSAFSMVLKESITKDFSPWYCDPRLANRFGYMDFTMHSLFESRFTQKSELSSYDFIDINLEDYTKFIYASDVFSLLFLEEASFLEMLIPGMLKTKTVRVKNGKLEWFSNQLNSEKAEVKQDVLTPTETDLTELENIVSHYKYECRCSFSALCSEIPSECPIHKKPSWTLVKPEHNVPYQFVIYKIRDPFGVDEGDFDYAFGLHICKRDASNFIDYISAYPLEGKVVTVFDAHGGSSELLDVKKELLSSFSLPLTSLEQKQVLEVLPTQVDRIPKHFLVKDWSKFNENEGSRKV